MPRAVGPSLAICTHRNAGRGHGAASFCLSQCPVTPFGGPPLNCWPRYRLNRARGGHGPAHPARSIAEEDIALGQQLLTNPKERHEHALVVKAIQENLEPLVTHLRLQPEPELYRLSNIQHLKTVIEGQLVGHGGILPVVEALHPTPSGRRVAQSDCARNDRRHGADPARLVCLAHWLAGPPG